MKQNLNKEIVQQADSPEDFNMGATITVLLLLLVFIGASFYVLVSSYMEVG